MKFADNKDKVYLCCDRLILICMCLLIFCLPFAKAGIETFTGIAFFAWLLKRLFGYRNGALGGLIPKTDINKALAFLVLADIVSVIFSTNHALALRGLFGKQLKYIAVYFMIVEVVTNKKRLKAILAAIFISAVFVMIDASVQYFTKTDFLRGHQLGYNSFGASFYSASGLAAWLIIIIPAFIGMAAYGIFPSLKFKIILLALTLIQFLYLLRTSVRGAWLGFIIAAVAAFSYLFKGFSYRLKLLCLFGAAFILFLCLFLPDSVTIEVKNLIRSNFKYSTSINERIRSIAQVDKGTNLTRVKLWKESLSIIRDYPLTGCGLNNYAVISKRYKSFSEGGIYPHNSYLQMGAETGILGLSAFLWMLFVFFRSILGYLKSKRDLLVLGFLAGILAFLVHAFFDTHFFALQLVVLLWFMFGLTTASARIGQAVLKGN